MPTTTHKPCHQENCERFRVYSIEATEPGVIRFSTVSDDGETLGMILDTCKMCLYFERFNLFVEKQ